MVVEWPIFSEGFRIPSVSDDQDSLGHGGVLEAGSFDEARRGFIFFLFFSILQHLFACSFPGTR
jgi:hypothetical protein